MPSEKIVILNGASASDSDLNQPFEILNSVLESKSQDITVYNLKEMKLTHCIGCFGCWTKTPGICVMDDDARKISASIIRCDTVILFTPVTFGGYSSTLKIMIDRAIPLISPFFGHFFGETHHLKRYEHYPRFIAIGVKHQISNEESQLFTALVKRNVLNFHNPTFSVGTIDPKQNQKDIENIIQKILSQVEEPKVFPVTSFFPPNVKKPLSYESKLQYKALLIVGSPKRKSLSFSSTMGNFLLDSLAQNGWLVDKLTLKADLRKTDSQNQLCTAVDKSNLIVWAFPLYVDSLPYLVTKAFEIIAENYKKNQPLNAKSMFALINNGFPEHHHNAVALAICRTFAEQTNLMWAGSLAVGAGEALGGGVDLNALKREGPPVFHIKKALTIAGRELSKGNSISASSQEIISKKPIPILPYFLWRLLFIILGKKWWIKRAKEHDVSKTELMAKPFGIH